MARGRRSILIQMRTDLDSRYGAKAIGEANDCTVRCIQHAFDLPYDLAHKFLSRNGRMNGRGYYFQEIVKALNVTDVSQWFEQCTIHKALQRMPKNYVFIVLIMGHVFAVKDGRIQDCFINSNENVMKVWQVNK